MEKLIAIQALVNQMEELTITEKKYHSKFNYLNDSTMQIETYCWDQAKTYKDLFDNMYGITVYMQGNSTIEIWEHM